MEFQSWVVADFRMVRSHRMILAYDSWFWWADTVSLRQCSGAHWNLVIWPAFEPFVVSWKRLHTPFYIDIIIVRTTFGFHYLYITYTSCTYLCIHSSVVLCISLEIVLRDIYNVLPCFSACSRLPHCRSYTDKSTFSLIEGGWLVQGLGSNA